MSEAHGTHAGQPGASWRRMRSPFRSLRPKTPGELDGAAQGAEGAAPPLSRGSGGTILRAPVRRERPAAPHRYSGHLTAPWDESSGSQFLLPWQRTDFPPVREPQRQARSLRLHPALGTSPSQSQPGRRPTPARLWGCKRTSRLAVKLPGPGSGGGECGRPREPAACRLPRRRRRAVWLRVGAAGSAGVHPVRLSQCGL